MPIFVSLNFYKDNCDGINRNRSDKTKLTKDSIMQFFWGIFFTPSGVFILGWGILI